MNRRLLLFFICLTSVYVAGNAQNKMIEMLKSDLKSAKHDTIRCSVLDQLIEVADEGEWQKYNEQMMQISLKNIGLKPQGRELKVFSKYYATALHNQGIIFSEQSDDDKAVEFFNRSIDISKKSGNKNEIAISLQAIAQIDIRRGNNTKALNQLYECLKIFEEVGDEIGIADVHLSIGDICFLQNDYHRAIEHHKKSHALYIKNKYEVALSTINFKIGVDYNALKDYSRALEYLQKSIDLIESSDYGVNSVAYLNIAQIYIYQFRYDKALEYALKGLKISESMQNKVEINHGHIVLSKIFKLQKKYGLSVSHAEEALKIGQETEHPAEISMAAKQLYDIYTETKEPEKANRFHQLYIETKAILDNQESKNALLEQKLKYEYEKKELINKAESEKKLVELASENQKRNLLKNIWLIVFGSVLVLVSVSVFFVYRNFKQKSVITNQKNNLLKQKLLVSQMNPHFIFNSLNAIQNYIFKQDSLKAGNYLTQFSELIRMILDFSRKDYISVESEVKLLNTYLELQKLRFESKFDYQISVDEKIDRETVHIPPMLAQPFIENAIEHGIFYKKEKGRVDVRLYYERSLLVYEIEDDGVGMEEAMKLKNKLKSSYESLATIITKERMDTLNEQSKSDIEIEIIDKKNNTAGDSGVKVKFVVPFKEI
ncbi:MAG: two-component system sensor histidine kinase [Bacteroidetes bacterium]|jgi:tetratricopeptide (TPR) repeat protein|nr:two-component system sensor histidine kinase [Bacteroidota bacterium]MDF2452359.1 two-component system sensor histidine kinase [Bacteroidota bacterium]